MTAANLPSVSPDTDGTAPTFPAQVREHLAVRLDRYERQWPAALDLLRDVTVALHDALNGHSATFRGMHKDSHWREILRGERDLSVKDLCRLMVSSRPEARTAVDRVLSVLSAARSTALALEAHEAVARLGEAHGVLTAEALRDLADGKLSAEEAEGLEPEIAAQEAALARLKATVKRAKEGR